MNRGKRSLTFKPASFNGKHNLTKLKVFMFLATYPNYEFNYQHIAFYAGVNANYISGRLRLWYEWNYLNRTKRAGQYYYQAWARCNEFISKAPAELVEGIIAEQRTRIALYPLWGQVNR